jgi:hypothetical protein
MRHAASAVSPTGSQIVSSTPIDIIDASIGRFVPTLRDRDPTVT